MLKIDRKIIQKHWYLLHWIHHKEKTDDCEKINSVNPLHLFIGHTNGYIEEKMELNT